MLWLVIEEVCPKLQSVYVAFFSNNSPTLSWVKWLAARGSLVAMQLVQALSLQLKNYGESPFTPLHISGKENYMMDIPSRSFVSNPSWFCKNDTDLLNLFKKHFPLPNQVSWAVFGPSSAGSMKVIYVLWMKHLEIGE